MGPQPTRRYLAVPPEPGAPDPRRSVPPAVRFAAEDLLNNAAKVSAVLDQAWATTEMLSRIDAQLAEITTQAIRLRRLCWSEGIR